MKPARFLFVTLGLLTAFTMTGLSFGYNEEIEDVMKKAFKKNGFRDSVNNELKKDSINWDTVKKASGDWVKLTEKLGKASPPKGNGDSWKKLSDEHYKTVKELADAVEKKDKAKVTKALDTMKKACETCHNIHRD